MKDLTYFQMRAKLFPRESNKSVSFKLKELEQIWYCTQKNVKRKLKRFEQDSYCTYIPGKGRGNLSILRFHKPFKKEIESAVESCIQREHMDDLMQLLQLPIPKPWVANISEDVQELFGLHSSSGKRDILRSIMTREITTLDPLFTSITFESYLIHQLGDTLVSYDEKSDCIYPLLAHHWLVDEDYQHWTFYLRKGVRFHHQRTMDSEDVLATFRRFESGNSAHSWLLNDIDSIECPSPYVVQFDLKKGNPFFLRMLSSFNLSILPKDVPFDEFQWIGTGPFKLKERSGQKLVLEAFDAYFLERPFLDEIEFWHVSPDHVPLASFQVEGERESESVQEKQEIEKGFRFLAFNFRKPTIVHDALFREAVFHLLDAKRMHKDLGREAPVESSSYFPEKSNPQPKDRSKIDELLHASGYDGQPLTLYALDFTKAQEEANWFMDEAKKHGICLELKFFSIKELYAFEIDLEADLLFMGEVASNDRHLSFLGAFYNEALIFRRFFGKDQLSWIENKLEEMKSNMGINEREERMEEIETYLKENNLILFMYHPIKRRTFHPMIRNIHFESFGHIDLRKLWIS